MMMMMMMMMMTRRNNSIKTLISDSDGQTGLTPLQICVHIRRYIPNHNNNNNSDNDNHFLMQASCLSRKPLNLIAKIIVTATLVLPWRPGNFRAIYLACMHETLIEASGYLVCKNILFLFLCEKQWRRSSKWHNGLSDSAGPQSAFRKQFSSFPTSKQSKS